MKKFFVLAVVYLISLTSFSCKNSTTPSENKQKPTILQFSISPDSKYYKDTTVVPIMTWSTSGATSCSISPDIGTVAATGSKQFAVDQTTTWTLTASNAAGSVTSTCSFTVKSAAYFTLLSYSQTMTSYHCPEIDGIVRNDGNAVGYNVMIEWQGLKNNVILDTASGFPADLGNIGVGISAAFEAVFFDLHNWSDIDQLKYTITWLNRDTMKIEKQTGRIRVYLP
jgi:hypothetical protein